MMEYPDVHDVDYSEYATAGTQLLQQHLGIWSLIISRTTVTNKNMVTLVLKVVSDTPCLTK